jgi:hypothetical protein
MGPELVEGHIADFDGLSPHILLSPNLDGETLTLR